MKVVSDCPKRNGLSSNHQLPGLAISFREGKGFFMPHTCKAGPLPAITGDSGVITPINGIRNW